MPQLNIRSLRMMPLLLFSWASVSSDGQTEEKSKGLVYVQGETHWPNSAWWSDSDATALAPTDPHGNTDVTARLESNAKVASVILEGASKATVTFTPKRRLKPKLALTGPARLADFLSKGQNVRLEIDSKGKIKKVGFMPELVSWDRIGSRHRIGLRVPERKSGNFQLTARSSQLFCGAHYSDGVRPTSEADFANAYNRWRSEETGKNYSQLSAKEKIRELSSRCGFEVILTSRGVVFFTGSEYGGAMEAESEWVLSESASEGFD